MLFMYLYQTLQCRVPGVGLFVSKVATVALAFARERS